MTGLFGLDRRIVQNMKLNPNTWKIALEIAAKTGVQCYPVTYIFEKRIAGSSKASIKPAIQFLAQLVRLYAWKLDIAQMMRFCVVGTSGLLVNVGIMTFLVELLRVDYRIAAIAGVTVAMLWNYVWNKFWTFKREEHAKQHSIGEGARSLGNGEAEAR
jgi:dolichol-phosphate mannosyltransferase